MQSRKVDELGRIVLPIEIRTELGIDSGDSLDVSMENGVILIEKSEQNCIICHGHEDLKNVSGRPVCAKCRDKIKKL